MIRAGDTIVMYYDPSDVTWEETMAKIQDMLWERYTACVTWVPSRGRVTPLTVAYVVRQEGGTAG